MKFIRREERVVWKNGSLSAEGLLCSSDGDCGVVVCHPHPQMGGSMHNNVVEAVRDAYAECGCSTLRFNFRGVGGSTGRYDEGNGEKQDVLSACEFLRSTGIKKIALAGYSFGAWVCCRLLDDNPGNLQSVILISPPQKYFDFDWKNLKNAVNLIICGDSDTFCDVEDLRKTADRISAELVVFRGTDHFFAGKESQLTENIKKYIEEKKLDFKKNGVMVTNTIVK
jgi:uncharacterized protein